MRDVTIFGNVTILGTFMFNDVQVDKGFDEWLDIFYRINLFIENSEDDINDAYSNECYFIVESIKVLKFRMIVSFLYIFSVRIINLLIWREHNYGGLVI